jgi:putative ABC transport system permease protein
MGRPSTARLKLLLRFALEGIVGQRGRSGLTMLGMAVGTASVVAVVSIGLFGREYVIGLIEGVGSNLVFAYGSETGVKREEITFGDVDAISQRVLGIGAMAPLLNTTAMMTVNGQQRGVTVLGTTAAYARVRNLVLQFGRFMTEREDRDADKVAVVSVDLARRLFGGYPPENSAVRIFGLRFRVIGVFREGVDSAAAVEKSEVAGLTAIIPFSTFRNVSGERWVDTIYVQAANPESVPGVVAGVREVLASRHRSPDSFKVESLQSYLVLAERVSRIITLGLIAIAGISLLVGGIGIMNIMLVTVTERTRELAIRLALGAGRQAILMQFLLEAAILSVAGGVLGLILGAGVPVYVGKLYGVEVPVAAASVVIAFVVSVAVGVFFGLYPARKAANMNIIDALAYE